MRLCIGATSRLVVEEAAKLRVPQIVASRAQVNESGGYTGMTQWDLVETVRRLSDSETQVVRDHGGPYQNGQRHDDWVAEFDLDVESGFDILHFDVSKLPLDDQIPELRNLCERYADKIDFEIGGERDDQSWLDQLLDAVTLIGGYTPAYAVVDLGGHIEADRQRGRLYDVQRVRSITKGYNERGVRTKAHNMDWVGHRRRYEGALDAYNVAPEFGLLETEVWLSMIDGDDARTLLEWGHASRRWEKWFPVHDIGTWYQQARCGVRYILNDARVRELLKPYERFEGVVRGVIRDAITAG